MLQEIYIKNFVLVDEVRISFREGLNVLTGETGAGKSIIVDALGLVLGERMRSDFIRDAEHKLITEAVFDISANTEALAILLENGLIEGDSDEGTLVITREIQAGGKSISRINGRIINAGLLKNLAGVLVDLHLQNARHNILKPANYLHYVDSFAGDIQSDLEQTARLYRYIRSCRARIDELRSLQSERLQRLDFLDFQIKELEALGLAPGEEDELGDLRSRVRDAAAFSDGSREIYGLLYGGPSSAYDHVAQALNIAARLNDTFFNQLQEPLNSIYYSFEDLGRQLEQFRQSLDFEPGTLDRIEQRLFDISRMTRKYGRTGDALLAYLDGARKEREELLGSEEREAGYEKELDQALTDYDQAARRLSHQRREAALHLEKAVYDELVTLNMPHLRFKVEVQSSGTPGPSGYDAVELLFSANPGEDMYPINKIASGGELSRFILALKKVLATIYLVPTMVFDEIDVGLGGTALQSMALKLAELARDRQLILITHAPQVASYASTHFLIDKEVDQDRTFTRVRQLEDAERVREVARMMGGEQFSDLTMRTSQEMIEQARQLAGD